jgi:hypothetical protein
VAAQVTIPVVWPPTVFQVFGAYVPPEAQDLITQLCTKDASKRLCCSPGKGVEELRNHQFFKDFNWTNLFCRRMPSPFRALISSAVESDDRYRPVAASLFSMFCSMTLISRRTRDSFVADTLTELQQVTLVARNVVHRTAPHPFLSGQFCRF